MELKIISNNDNKLLNRKEIRFSVEQSGSTVTRMEVAKELCKRLNLSPEGTIIVRIDQGFGKKESSGLAHSYENRETLEKYESKSQLGKGVKKGAKEAVKSDAKAEDKKE